MPCDAAERCASDEHELLIPGRIQIGVDQRQANDVLAVDEVADHIPCSTQARFAKIIAGKRVHPQPSGQKIGPGLPGQHILPRPAGQRVIAAPAQNSVVAVATLHRIRALQSADQDAARCRREQKAAGTGCPPEFVNPGDRCTCQIHHIRRCDLEALVKTRSADCLE